VREQLKTEAGERKQLEQTLTRTREELELRLKERATELARAQEELKKRDAELAGVNDKLKAETSAHKRAEETLHKKQQELEARAKELAAQLDQSRHELSERTTQMAQASDELRSRADDLTKLNEELKNEAAAHKQAEARGSAFARAARELSAARSAQDAARVIAGVTQELIRWDAFGFDLYCDDEGKILPVLNIDTVNGHAADVPPTYPGPDPSPIMRRVMKDGPQLILRSGPSSSHTDYILFGDRARLSASLMYVAIRAGERVVGFLALQSYAPNAYDQPALETLQALADHCGSTLERIRSEEARRRSDERFRLIARATNDVVWDWNLETDQVWWNEAFQSVFGYKPGEIEPGSESWKSRIHTEDRDRVVAGIQRCLEQGEEAWSDEYRFLRSDGGYAHIMNRGHVIRDEEKKPLRMIGAIADVSQRKQVEEAMIENQARKGAILEMALDCIITIDHEGKVFEWNPAAERTFGYRRSDVLGKELAALIVPPAHRERHRQGLAHYIQTGEGAMVGKQVEIPAIRSDGSEFPVELEITRISKEGPPIFTAFIRDITERKRAEMEIQKLAAFPRWNPNPVLEFAADGALTYYNDAAKEMALSLGKDHPAAILPEGAAGIVKECLAKGQSKLRLETTVASRTILWSFFPIISNQVVHCYAADATERLSLESQLRHAQKMESIGQLAASVAHDFNNILSIVQGYSTLLMEEKDLKPEMSDALKQIASATERATHLTRQLLTFSRKQQLNVRTLDLNEVINSVSKLLRRLVGENVALQFNYSPSLPAVEADTGMLEQVVMNLAINARDAMPGGGQLVIGTKVTEIDEDYVQHNPEARTGRFVCLSVADTGCGMDEVTLARIFEPFFTTKGSGKGTGLGLATVYGIVKQHRGWIEVQSRIAQGTTFRIFLPVSGKSVVPTTESSSKPATRGGTETILLVEDEPAVLAMAKGILQRLGYKIFEASSGDEALQAWSEHGAQIDLLLTDMVMPGSLNGRELAERLQPEKPALKIIYTSGYSMELLGTGLTASRNFVFLQKPYHPDSLASVVRNCLDGKLS
jgi:PAS domain S-box-containing protein